MFVPRRYQRHQATRIYADVHLVSRPRSLRVSSMILRTRSAVNAGVPEGALATTNEPLRTHLTFLYTGSIWTLPSQYSMLTELPGANPADSRTAFGITTRPAWS